MKKVLLLLMVLFVATTSTAATTTDTQTFDDLGWSGSYEKIGSTNAPLPDGWYLTYDNENAKPETNATYARSGYCVLLGNSNTMNLGYTATLIFPAKAGSVSVWARAYAICANLSVKFYKMTPTGTGTFTYGTELASAGSDVLTRSAYTQISAALDEDGYVGLKFCCAYVDDISNTYEVAPTTHTVSGTVKDANGATLSGATVTLTPGSYSATTDANGAFALADVPEGDYTATASLAGYTAASTSISVAADVTDVALTLSPVVTTVNGIITKYNSDNST
ncbi:MAG: carboxypeptidase-like regulatory domain-containing protein [Muribaculaceae bacterium]